MTWTSEHSFLKIKFERLTKEILTRWAWQDNPPKGSIPGKIAPYNIEEKVDFPSATKQAIFLLPIFLMK